MILDWSKIDNEKTFQRMTNHLFALECNSPGFIPSDPYIGADGAFDGYYKGFYPQEVKDGLWSIQAKWTTQTGVKAVRHLKKQIKVELRKARRKKVDHLRIATNAKLKVDQVLELKRLNSGEVTTLEIWSREDLTRRIELQPFVRHYFFGSPQHLKFVPWNVYFNEVEKHLLPVPANKIEKFREYISKIVEFLRSDISNVLLIHSPGGYGKSHLIREIARTAHQVDPERQAWMTRTGYPRIENAIQDEIMEGRKYLIILDDADRFPDEIEPLLAFSKHRSDSTKVILTARTSGLESIYDLVRKLKFEQLFDEMRISDWSRDDLVRLLRIVTKQDKIDDEETIAAACSNPFLIVWIGKQIRKESALDLKKIKQEFVNDVDYEAQRCLRGVFRASEMEEFMVNLACLTPFSKNDSNVLGILSKKFRIETNTIVKSIDTLERVGILRVVGDSLRFNPDMKGDLYLSYKLEKTTDPERTRRLVETWLPMFAEKLLTNLESAARYADIPDLETVLSDIVDSWIETAEDTPAFVRILRLNLAERIANLVPRNCLNLLHTYMNSNAPSLNDRRPKSSGLGELLPTTDNYGPIIAKLMRIPFLRKEVAEMIYKMDTKNIEGIYDNYKPTSLMKGFVSPLHNYPDSIISALDVLLEWLDEPDDSRIRLISAALSEVLAGSHEFTRSTIGKTIFGERTLKDSLEVREIRDKAFSALENMVCHSSLKVRLAAVRTSEKIGTTAMGRLSQRDLPLSNKITKERKIIVKKIGGLISPDTDFLLLSEIEDLFLKWWAQLTPGTDKVEQYLYKIPRSPEYIAFRHFVSLDYAIDDFDSLRKQAPTNDRWGWFVRTHMHKTIYSKPEDFTKLAEALNMKHSTKNRATEFIEYLGEICAANRWAHPPIITCWVKTNPRLFSSIRNEARLWNQIPQMFRDEIELAMAKYDRKFFYKLAREVFSELPKTSISKVESFLRSLRRQCVAQRTLHSWLSQLLGQGSPEIRALVVFHLSFVLKKISISSVIKLLALAISKEKELTTRMVDSLSFVVQNLRKNIDSLDRKEILDLRRKLLRRLKEVLDLDYHAQNLLDFAFYGIDSVISFTEFRLSRSKQIEKGRTDERYVAIPFAGIDCIRRQIKSFNDYEKLMTNVITCYEKNVLRNLLKNLMKPIETLLNSESGKPYAQEYVEQRLRSGNIENAIVACEFLSFEENTLPILIEVADKGIALGKSEDVEKLLHHKIYPERGWSANLGEPSPELIARRDLFQKMYKRANPGKLPVLIEACIEAIDRRINLDAKSDAEFLMPRVTFETSKKRIS